MIVCAVEELRLQAELGASGVRSTPDLKGRPERRQPLGDQLVESIEGFPLDLVHEAGVQLREVASKVIDRFPVGGEHLGCGR